MIYDAPSFSPFPQVLSLMPGESLTGLISLSKYKRFRSILARFACVVSLFEFASISDLNANCITHENTPREVGIFASDPFNSKDLKKNSKKLFKFN